MKRDNDKIREILLQFEAEEGPSLIFFEDLGQTQEERSWLHHVLLLTDSGFLAEEASARHQRKFRLTNSGHDFVEAIRDDGIWRKTKDSAAIAGGTTLKMLFSISASILEQKIKQVAGLTGR